MAKNPWFPLYVSDYLSKTTGLTAELHGAYLLLLMAYWVRGKPLPDDDTQLAEMTRITGKRWAAARKVLEQFFTVEDGVWRNKRMDEELAEAGERFERRSKAGRMNRQRATNGQPMVDQQEDQSCTHPHPQSQDKNNTKDYGGGFDVQTRIVAGGFKQIGAGKRIKNPRRADEAMQAYLASHCGLSDFDARAMVSAARDPTAAGHHDARRFCLQVSRDNKLGWFEESAA